MTLLTQFALALALAQAPQPSAPAAPTPPPPSAPPAPSAPPPLLQPTPPAAPAGEVLTLADALRIADAQNLDLKAAQARLRQSDELHYKAWSGYLPQLTASGSFTVTKLAAIPAGSFGPGTPEVVIQPGHQTVGLLQVTQALIAPQLWFAIPNAQRGEEIGRLNLATARREVLFGVAQAYYGVASLKRALEVAHRLLEIAQRGEKDARVRYQAGAVAKVALLRAEIDRARAEQDVKRAENSLESARIALATLLNRRTDFDVTDPPDVVLTGDAASFEETAVRNRPEVRASRIAVDVQRGNKDQVLSRYLPVIGGFGQFQASDPAGFSGETSFFSAGVSLQWRIFDGGLRESDYREAKARIDEASATSASTELVAREEVRQAYLDMESARANAAKAKEQRDLAAENQRLVDVAFRAGTATAVEQADAVAQLRTAEINAITESLNAQLATLRVLRAAGVFQPTQP